MRRRARLALPDLSFCVLVTSVTIILSALFQRPLTINGGLGWDGVSYTRIATSCWHVPIVADPPFVYRVGGPCVAALLSSQPVEGMFRANVLAAVAAIVLLALYLPGQVADRRVRYALLAAYVVYWQGPLRIAWWGPAELTDAWLHLFLIAGLLALESRRKTIWVAAIVLVGGLFREAVMVLALALLVQELPDVKKAIRTAWPALMTAGVSLLITRLVGHPSYKFGFVSTALNWVYTKTPPQLVHATFVAFGPMLALLVAFPEAPRRWLIERKDIALTLMVLLLLAWFGGGDTDRLLYWSAPIVLVLVGKSIESVEWAQLKGPLALVVAAQMLSERVLLTTPDSWSNAPRAWPLLTPVRAQWNRLLMSMTPDVKMGMLAICEYLALTATLAWWLRHALVTARGGSTSREREEASGLAGVSLTDASRPAT
jgi:hypothetical protein